MVDRKSISSNFEISIKKSLCIVSLSGFKSKVSVSVTVTGGEAKSRVGVKAVK